MPSDKTSLSIINTHLYLTVLRDNAIIQSVSFCVLKIVVRTSEWSIKVALCYAIIGNFIYGNEILMKCPFLLNHTRDLEHWMIYHGESPFFFVLPQPVLFLNAT